LQLLCTRNTKPTQDTHDQEEAHPMVHRAAAIKKTEEGTPYNTKLKNDDVLKSTSDNVCSVIDSLKKECCLKMAQ
jgi:hypothetical protein